MKKKIYFFEFLDQNTPLIILNIRRIPLLYLLSDGDDDTTYHRDEDVEFDDDIENQGYETEYLLIFVVN